jgi:hypothetical protein
LRPKTFTTFNTGSKWIKIVPVSGKKNEVIIEFILGDNVPAEALWFFGWGLARSFVVALNIGTMGFWWWRMPEQISRYYEALQDLETGKELVIERNPILISRSTGARGAFSRNATCCKRFYVSTRCHVPINQSAKLLSIITLAG